MGRERLRSPVFSSIPYERVTSQLSLQRRCFFVTHITQLLIAVVHLFGSGAAVSCMSGEAFRLSYLQVNRYVAPNGDHGHPSG